jgi:hypothetical protein
LAQKHKSAVPPSAANLEGINAAILADNFAARFNATDWIRVKHAARQAKVSRAMIYVWLHDGCFKSCTIKRQGFERGIRYIEKPSFEHFLKSHFEEAPV